MSGTTGQAAGQTSGRTSGPGETDRRTQDDALGAIWAAITKALRSATHLQVVTVLGDAGIELSHGLDEVKVVFPKPPAQQGTTAEPYSVLATNIDLAFGDISQTLSPYLMDGSQAAVLKLHNDMLAQGQKIVADNLTLLKDLVKELKQATGG